VSAILTAIKQSITVEAIIKRRKRQSNQPQKKIAGNPEKFILGAEVQTPITEGGQA
jgi:hypothetical protein